MYESTASGFNAFDLSISGTRDSQGSADDGNTDYEDMPEFVSQEFGRSTKSLVLIADSPATPEYPEVHTTCIPSHPSTDY